MLDIALRQVASSVKVILKGASTVGEAAALNVGGAEPEALALPPIDKADGPPVPVDDKVELLHDIDELFPYILIEIDVRPFKPEEGKV